MELPEKRGSKSRNMWLSVVKFGGSILQSQADLPVAVTAIRREIGRGRRVAVVVSAFGRTTDHLLAMAHEITPDPEPAALALLLSTGENATMALVTLALREAGVAAVDLDVDRAGLVTRGPVLDAWPVVLDADAMYRALDSPEAAVFPGFVGRDVSGTSSVLGRGGSDLSALFLAHALDARSCCLYKDVDGVYERDPGLPGQGPGRFSHLAYEDAYRLDNTVLPRKAICFAERHGLCFDVGRPSGPVPTRVGPGPSVLERAPARTNQPAGHSRSGRTPGARH
jgi:homoserine dehydrogenase